MSARNGRIASSTQKDTWLWAYAALGAVLAFGYAAVTRKVTSPYMVRRLVEQQFNRSTARLGVAFQDEPFHVPQAQRYCRGDFWTWDPKLTTPPGLYLFAAGLVQLLQLVAPLFGLQTKGLGDVVCSLASLRAWNLLFSIGTFWTIHSILLELRRQRQAAAQKADKKLENGVQASNSYLEAFAIILFPVSFFFHFLYYTDSGSTLFVLLAYLWMLERRYWKSAIVRSRFSRGKGVVFIVVISLGRFHLPVVPSNQRRLGRVRCRACGCQ